MSNEDIDLRSVNWEYGMLLTPEHFLRQERYIDSMLLWVLRYGIESYGLVGAGARMEPAERGAVKHDPKIDIHDEEDTIKISVSQCRGITPAGDIIDIDPTHALHQSFSKKELEGHNELSVHVVCETHDKIVESALNDEANPQMKSLRRPHYRIQLDTTAAQSPHSLTLTRLKKAETTLRYERVAAFIPVCTTLVAHSELRHVWEKLTRQLSELADRYTELHKAIVEYVSMAKDRQIDSREDDETLQFVGRMVVTLESCAYALLDPLQSPQRFFQHLYRAIRSAAIYLDLSPPTQAYFKQLAEGGETEFSSLLEQERQTLLTNRELSIHDNLKVDDQRIVRALYRLRRLEEALEGKYLDFRVSTALEALNFFFDRQFEPPALFKSLAKPSRSQVFAEELTFVFAVRLEGRQKYRLILVGTPEAHFEVGMLLSAEIRLNEGAGQQIEPIYGKARCDLPDQRNFAMEFDAPSHVQAISDIRVVVNAALPIRNCLLYGRRYLQQGRINVSPVPPREIEQPPLPPPGGHRQEPEYNRPPRLSSPEVAPDDRISEWDAKPRRKRLE